MTNTKKIIYFNNKNGVTGCAVTRRLLIHLIHIPKFLTAALRKMCAQATENWFVCNDEADENESNLPDPVCLRKRHLEYCPAGQGGIGLLLKRNPAGGEFTIKAIAPNSPSALCGKMKVSFYKL